MKNYKIVMDSSCDLYPGHPEANFTADFASVPLTIIIGDTQYSDLPTTDVEAMFAHMKAHRAASSSACPSVEEFAAAFMDSDNIIAITISGNLSGSFNAAQTAAKLVREEYPEKNIHVVDSLATSGTMVLIARYADALLAQGLPFAEVAQKVDSYRNTLRILFTLSCYDNLIKAGRMSKTAGLVATALNIRAVANNTVEGKIEVVEKLRGEKKALERTIELMAGYKDMMGKPVVISHCHNEEIAKQAAELISKAYKTKDITILKTRCLTTYYSDDKSLLVSF